MDKQTIDALAIALSKLATLSDQLRETESHRSNISATLTRHVLTVETTPPRQVTVTDDIYNAHHHDALRNHGCSTITFRVPQSLIPNSLTVDILRGMPFSLCVIEMLLRIALHAQKCRGQIIEELIINKSGDLAPMLHLSRAKLTDFDLPADIALPRAIDPFGDDDPPITQPPTQEETT